MKRKLKDPFYTAAVFLTGHISVGRDSAERRLLDEELTALAGGRKQAPYEFRVKRAASVMRLGTLLLAVISGTVILLAGTRRTGPEEQLARDGYGGSIRRTELAARIEGESEDQIHEIAVRPRAMSGEQADGLLEAARGEFDACFLNENKSRDEVRTDLYFPRELQDGLVRAEYLTVPYGYVGQDGKLGKEPDPDGTLVEIKVTFTCQDRTLITETTVAVLPPMLTEGEALYREVERSLHEADDEQAESEYLLLPEQAQSRRITWHRPKRAGYGFLFLLLPAVLLFYYCHQGQRVHERARERREQLAADYPDMLWQLVMLLRAGMTIRAAFVRTAAGYEKRRGGEKKKYVYEEMLYSCREMQNGVPESKVYEQFGRRCGLPAYIKLGTVLSQNLRKGSAGLAGLLEKEARISMEDMKNLVRKKGEKAGAKLVFPMMLMLLAVLIILMAPAFFSFSV